jgi:5-methylcytosine-specific restriction endonuclease McrA
MVGAVRRSRHIYSPYTFQLFSSIIKYRVRLCGKCNIERPVSEFYKQARRSDGLQTWCIPCKKAEAKTPESKARYAQNYRDNKERRDAQANEWVKRNPQRSKDIKAAWKRRNPEAVCELSKAYAKRNPDKVLARNKRRRARKKNAPGEYTWKEWLACIERFDFHCAYCGEPFTEKRLPTQDHLTPLVHGGHHTDSNIVPACRSCNSRKRTRTLEEFVKLTGLGEYLLLTHSVS